MNSPEILKQHTDRYGNIRVGSNLPETLYYLEGTVYSNACKRLGIPYVRGFHGFSRSGRKNQYCSPIIRGIVVVKADLNLIWQEVGPAVLKKALKNNAPAHLSVKSVDAKNLLPISLRIPYVITAENDIWLRRKLIEIFVRMSMIKAGYSTLAKIFSSKADAAEDIICLAACYVDLDVEEQVA